MNVGRLAWRTPTGAMLWEIWGRHKMNFLWQSVALAACLFFVHCKKHGVSDILGAVLTLASLGCFLAAYLHLLTCFAYVEVDSVKVKVGYPGRLLLKPLCTFQLVMVPMFFGGLATTTTINIWVGFVLKPMGFLPVYDLSGSAPCCCPFFGGCRPLPGAFRWFGSGRWSWLRLR